jgi:hypothetical protein
MIALILILQLVILVGLICLEEQIMEIRQKVVEIAEKQPK